MYWQKKKATYDILIPENTKPFEEFSKTETEEYFSWYINKIPERAQYLSLFSSILLDHSVESLVGIWSWFIKIAKKEKTPAIKITELKMQLKGQPKEFIDSIIQENKEQLSLETMYIARDIAMYFGEVAVKNNKALYWGYHTDIKKDSFANRPLVMGYEDRSFTPPYKFYIDPDFTVQSFANGILSNSTYSTELLEGYQKMQKSVHN